MVIGSLQGSVPTYDQYKEYVKEVITEDYLKQTFKEAFGDKEYSIVDLKQTDMDASFGKVIKTTYSINCDNTSYTQDVYDFIIGNYSVEVATCNLSGTDLSTMTEYIINSLIVK